MPVLWDKVWNQSIMLQCIVGWVFCILAGIVATFDGDGSIERVIAMVVFLPSLPFLLKATVSLELSDPLELLVATLLGLVGFGLGYLVSLALGLNVSNLS